MVCFGGEDFSEEEKEDFKKKGLQDIVKYITGDDSLLYQYYKNAYLFVHTSLYEGFGLPVLEAMSCGTPVVCSKSTSLPEVGADAVSYCDPYNTQDIKNKIKKIISNNSLHQKMVNNGIIQSKKFSWLITAKKYKTIFNKVYNER